MRKVTFSNICVITEDIYLKLRLSCLLSSGELIPVGQVTLNFFLIVMPLFRLRIFTQIQPFSNVSVFAEDIHFKLGVVIYYQKGNPFQ